MGADKERKFTGIGGQSAELMADQTTRDPLGYGETD